jgi:hypothetical protein
MKCKNCKKTAVAKSLCANCYYTTPDQKRKISNRSHQRQENQKVRALSHYGRAGKLQCKWKNCSVKDIDMLTLDHINDDGGKHVNSYGRKLTGIALYFWAINNSFPEKFQTLCANHQLKKAIMKKNRDRENRHAFQVKKATKVYVRAQR